MLAPVSASVTVSAAVRVVVVAMSARYCVTVSDSALVLASILSTPCAARPPISVADSAAMAAPVSDKVTVSPVAIDRPDCATSAAAFAALIDTEELVPPSTSIVSTSLVPKVVKSAATSPANCALVIVTVTASPAVSVNCAQRQVLRKVSDKVSSVALRYRCRAPP